MINIEKLQKSSFGDVVEQINYYITVADPVKKAEALEGMTVDEFISHRLDIYFSTLQKSIVAGSSLGSANEVAMNECLAGLKDQA